MRPLDEMLDSVPTILRHDLHIFQACVCYLLNSPSKQAMHDRFRKEFEYVWPKDFVLYYRQRLLPRSGRLGRYENSQK